MTIGQVSDLSGVPITTLRFYEKRQLLDPPLRVGGRRQFDPSVLVRLMLIRYCRAAGLSLAEIALVVSDESGDNSVRRQLAAQRVLAIDAQVEQLGLARLMMVAASTCSCLDIENCSCGAMATATEQVLTQKSAS